MNGCLEPDCLGSNPAPASLTWDKLLNFFLLAFLLNNGNNLNTSLGVFVQIIKSLEQFLIHFCYYYL